MQPLEEKLIGVVGKENVVSAPAGEYEKSVEVINPGQLLKVGSAPDIVVRPGSTSEVGAVVKIANSLGAPTYVQSGGTDTTGGCIPVRGGITIDMRRMNRILKISPDGMYATVQAACPLMQLDQTLARRRLRLGHYPTSILLGVTAAGAVSTYGMGAEASGYDSIGDHVLGMEVVTPTGEVLRVRPLYKSSMLEKNLMWLFIGAQGQHGIITELTLGVQPFIRSQRRIRVFEFRTFERAVKCSYAIHRRRIRPALLFSMNKLRAQFSAPSIAERAKVGGLLFIGIDEVVPRVGAAVDSSIKKLCRQMGGRDLGPRIARDVTDNLYKAGSKFKRYYDTDSLVNFSCTFPDMETGLEFYAKAAKLCAEYGLIHTATHWGPRQGAVSVTHGSLTESSKELSLKNMECRFRLMSLAVEMGGTADTANGSALRNSYFLKQELGEVGVDVMKAIKRTLDPKHVMTPGMRWEYWEDREQSPRTD